MAPSIATTSTRSKVWTPASGVQLVHDDCLRWLARQPEHSIHSVVTDPPYGVKEYEPDQLAKLRSGQGGIWRIPPSFDGSKRSPLPRFTALDMRERAALVDFFTTWALLVEKALRPGGHVFIATNSFVAQLCYSALIEGGLEFRGQVIRLVRTLRGGDRPKGSEDEFPEVSSMPRGAFEPWGIFRKPLPKNMTVAECLREYETGGIRRYAGERPFEDVIPSERTPRAERAIADHPSIKPQSLLRKLVYVSLPLGTGVVVDPFAGSGSTLAAAAAIGYEAVGVERSDEYIDLARKAIPRLAKLELPGVDPLVGGPAASGLLY